MTPAVSMTVPLGERSYPIHIGDGLLRDPAWLGALLPARKVAVISNDIVAPLYAASIHAARAGAETHDIVLADGESQKTLTTVARIFDALLERRFARDDLIVALGGGVVGDMAGFAAACYQRGIGFVQVPTTLLAQVDSSVGGKTGVNHPLGKNMIGAFHQPRAVIADIATLRTLPTRELRAGLAEVVKYGLICDAGFFDWLEANVAALLALDPAALVHAVHRSCAIKAEIVARDEHEQGDRALLNLGHTFGHAIESLTGYSRWLHGEAVAAGMLMAATMSRRCGLMSNAEVERLERLLRQLGLRTDARGEATPAAALAAMGLDKKVKAGRVRLVLMRRIGEAFVSADYADDALAATLEAHLA
ncbi:MAG: 3-dehydroquinate synthase [Gammaproteobacteria bacterium]|nr:3-dehydroquinate synthase [Gammaproteobacteria bacterium]